MAFAPSWPFGELRLRWVKNYVTRICQCCWSTPIDAFLAVQTLDFIFAYIASAHPIDAFGATSISVVAVPMLCPSPSIAAAYTTFHLAFHVRFLSGSVWLPFMGRPAPHGLQSLLGHLLGDAAMMLGVSSGAAFGNADHALRHVRTNPLPVSRLGLHCVSNGAEGEKGCGGHLVSPFSFH
jgi:hypothetical protein